MDIGTLERRIRIEQKMTVQDPDYGTESLKWVPLGVFWANVQEVLPSNAEKQPNGIRIENRPARIRMRYVAGISSDMRIIFLDRDNREMKIVSGPTEMGRREGLELMVEEYSTSGTAS